MKIYNLISKTSGNAVANQFVKTDFVFDSIKGEMFQSYDSNICFISDGGVVLLDPKYYAYSKTTIKYRNQFLGRDTKTIESKIKSGEYRLVDLN